MSPWLDLVLFAYDLRGTKSSAKILTNMGDPFSLVRCEYEQVVYPIWESVGLSIYAGEHSVCTEYSLLPFPLQWRKESKMSRLE